MSTNRDRRIADQYLGDHLPCNRCSQLAPREDLAALGAMCRVCFASYCAEANPAWLPSRPLLPHERAAVVSKARAGLVALGQQPRDPKAWAHRLRDREESGDHLSPLQRRFWREALGVRVNDHPQGDPT